MRLRLPPSLLLALAALLWSGNFVIGRAMHGRVPPLALAFWRWTGALALLLALSWPALRAQWAPLRRAWRVVVPLGVLGAGCFNTFVYVGLRDTTATNALLLNSACPAFIVAIGFASGSGRASARQLVGIAVSLLGVVTILGRGAPTAVLSLAFRRGDLWVLLAVACWAFYTVLLRRRPAGVSPLVLLTALSAVGVAFVAPWYAWEVARGERLQLDLAALGSILYVAVFASVAAFVLWNAGVARVGATRAGVYLHLMPAFGSLLAVAVLGEALRPFHLVGIGLILAGVSLAGASAPAPRQEGRAAAR
jgi:drug/metabolite transporter (DMT)-like permease